MLGAYTLAVGVPLAPLLRYAEAVIIGFGKPTLVLPERPRKKSLELNTVVVAWDFSRTATRAIADAMPVLQKAKRVQVVTVLNEKALGTTHSADEVAKNLSRHGIDTTVDEVDAAAWSIGEVLESHATSCASDILVMGTYGHSRLREINSWRRDKKSIGQASPSDSVFPLTVGGVSKVTGRRGIRLRLAKDLVRRKASS